MQGAYSLFRSPNPPVGIPITEMSASECLDGLVDVDKQIAALQARRLRILARFGELRPANRPGVTFADGAREEVSIEIGVSPDAALAQIAQAEDLVTRLPGTVSALAAGDIDFRRALAMRDCTGVLSVEDAGLVERRVLAYGPRANPSKFRDAVRHHVKKVDPTSAERRRQEALDQRDVLHYADEDGTGQVTAILSAEEARLTQDRIDKLARLRTHHRRARPRTGRACGVAASPDRSGGTGDRVESEAVCLGGVAGVPAVAGSDVSPAGVQYPGGAVRGGPLDPARGSRRELSGEHCGVVPLSQFDEGA
jgi:hypothetical protein